MSDQKLALKIRKAIYALNKSRPTKEKTANARRQANQAKTILHTHKKRKPLHHKKVAIKASN